MIFKKFNRPLRVNDQGKEMVEHGTAQFPIACFEQDVAARPVIWHWHDDWEIIVATGGTVVVSVCSEKYRLEPGQGIFINSGIPHEVFGEGSDAAMIHSAVFHPRITGSMDSIYWQKYIEPVTKNPDCQSVLLDGAQPWHGDFVAAMETAWQSVAEEKDCYEFEVRAALSEAVILLHTHFPTVHKELSEQEMRNLERIKLMLQYVQEHYDEELTIAKIAESAAISESECLRCFHKTIGTTPIQYLKQFRIQRAAELLTSTNQKIVDVAMDCGFTDATYFIRQFRKVKGCTPKEYREKHSGRQISDGSTRQFSL